MTSKKTLYIITLVLGLVLVGVSLFVSGEELKILSGVLIGIGAGLFGMSIAQLYMVRWEEKNPELTKQNQIELKDERNTLIRSKAKAQAGDITQWFIVGLAFITIIIEAPLWVTLVTIGVYLLYNILSLYLISRYQKEM